MTVTYIRKDAELESVRLERLDKQRTYNSRIRSERRVSVPNPYPPDLYNHAVLHRDDYIIYRKYITLAGEAGHREACFYIGKAHNYGDYGFEKDAKRAVLWYEKAADLGCDEAIARLAHIYYNGFGVEKDTEKGKALYFELANNHNCPYAACELGEILIKEAKGEHNETRSKGIFWLQKAARQGNKWGGIKLNYYGVKAHEEAFEQAEPCS